MHPRFAERVFRESDVSVYDLFSVKGKAAIVTGASYGLGVTFAEALADGGANVVLAARSTDKLEAGGSRPTPERLDGSEAEYPVRTLALRGSDD